jgi:hypothetical protein
MDSGSPGADMLSEWYRSKKLAVEKQVAYLHKLRLRAFGIVFGLGLAAFGIVSMTVLPAIPVFVGAFAVAALVVNKVAAQLSNTVCIGCGEKIESEPVGQYGVVCPKCGTISASSGFESSDLTVHPDDSAEEDESNEIL